MRLHETRSSVVDRVRGGVLAVRQLPSRDRLRASGVRLGSRVALERGVVIDEEWGFLIEIGDECTFAPRVMVFAHDASMRRTLGLTKVAPVTIGKRVYLGAASIVLPGVTIGDDAIVGAGSVVSRDLDPGVLAVGVPARAIGPAEVFLARQQARIDEGDVWVDLRAWRMADDWPTRRAVVAAAVREHGVGWVK